MHAHWKECDDRQLYFGIDEGYQKTTFNIIIDG